VLFRSTATTTLLVLEKIF